MLESGLAGSPPTRYTGLDPFLRAALQDRGVGYVLAVARNHRVALTTHLRERVDQTAAHLSEQAWQRYSCGPGAKGNRWYDWAFVAVHDDRPGVHSSLIRRSGDGELAFTAAGPHIRCHCPHWCVLREPDGQSRKVSRPAKGLDQYQCRKWTAWYRFTTLAMLALATLTAIAVACPPPPSELIPLTIPEIRRLINLLILHQPPNISQALRWSYWRRQHQARAKASHYKRRDQLELNH